MAELVRWLGHDRVLSSGTFLDSLRFRFHLALRLKVSPADVDAMILGEHGTNQVFLWSSARLAGAPVLGLLDSARGHDELRREVEDEVRYANIAIIEGIGASQYGIGMVSARIAEICRARSGRLIPIGSFHPKYGVTLSVPSVLGRSGLVERHDPEMFEEEHQARQHSADTLKSAVSRTA